MDLLKDQLMKKEGLETRVQDYKHRLDALKDAVDLKNQALIAMKDMELQLRESQEKMALYSKIVQGLKEEVGREREIRVTKELGLKKVEGEF